MVRPKKLGRGPASKIPMMVASSSEEEDSDVERNFTLLTERGGEEEEVNQEEEHSEEDEEESEEEGKEGSEASEEEDNNDEDDKEPDNTGESSASQTREDIKNELSSMSFQEILELQNTVGTKVYNQVAYGGSSGERRGESSKKKRLNKNRPVEISAKKPAPFLRQVVAIKKPTLRDPRFDDLSGEYKPEIFEKTYRFINDIKQREREIIHKKLKKMKASNQRKEKLQFLLKRMENQERARTSREQQRERELQFKRQQRERANQGARPFFLKKSEKKKLQLVEKYQELKRSGKLDNFLSKKRKRNAGKDRRKLPKQQQTKK